jgi:hypothetical protein
MSIATLILLTSLSAGSAPGRLAGQVLDEHGAPLFGAVVDLYTAKPRVGLAVTCPSCYRDCAKSARSDDQGRFSIGDLDPELLFHVLVMAPGRRAVLTKLIDPAQAELEVKLEPLPGSASHGRSTMRPGSACSTRFARGSAWRDASNCWKPTAQSCR